MGVETRRKILALPGVNVPQENLIPVPILAERRKKVSDGGSAHFVNEADVSEQIAQLLLKSARNERDHHDIQQKVDLFLQRYRDFMRFFICIQTHYCTQIIVNGDCSLALRNQLARSQDEAAVEFFENNIDRVLDIDDLKTFVLYLIDSILNPIPQHEYEST